MIIEIGHFALILALIVALIQGVAPLIGARKGKESWMRLAGLTSISLFGLSTIGFFTLLHAYALSDFSVRNVAENSHTMKPVLYKLAGAWGNHEGSMLLFALVLSFWTCRLATARAALPLVLRARALAIQALLCVGVFSFILFTSNPFLRLDPPPAEGLGLNPLLQDPLLALHPPFLYMGYVGFSVVFSLAVAGLMSGAIDRAWAGFALPFARAAWVFLTIGIALGSFWAYYELGWGGFWFWDPVENASLMPWLSGTALLHSMVAQERRGQFSAWTVFLAILTFSLSLLGTFLVRSGVLTSVHAFAVDPSRGFFILALIAFVTGGAFTLFAIKSRALPAAPPFARFSREAGIFLNNLFFFAFLVTVFTGTLYPLFAAALNAGDLSVGAPYFSFVLLIFLPLFAFLLGAAPFSTWGHDMTVRQGRKILPVLAFATALGVLGVSLAGWAPSTALGIAAGSFIALATLQHLLQHTRFLTAWTGVTPSYLGMIVAHLGFGLVVIGFAATAGLRQEVMTWATPGQNISVAGYTLTYRGTTSGLGPNYNTEDILLEMTAGENQPPRKLMPQKNWYPVAKQATSEVALYLTPTGGMIYAVAGDVDADKPQRVTLRIYYHPLVAVLLGGALFMVLGGAIALAQRRGRAHAD